MNNEVGKPLASLLKYYNMTETITLRSHNIFIKKFIYPHIFSLYSRIYFKNLMEMRLKIRFIFVAKNQNKTKPKNLKPVHGLVIICINLNFSKTHIFLLWPFLITLIYAFYVSPAES